MEVIDLSVLICSTHTRWRTFGRAIQEQIWAQHEALIPAMQQRVEILMFTDNKQMMLGQKRNIMVDAAQGKYVVFVDDDDRLEPSYLYQLLLATGSDADVITFLVSVSLNKGTPKPCRYSIDFKGDRNTSRMYERLPNHICAVKRELASRVSFPNVPYGEDSGYSKLLKPLLKTEHHIPQVLYHYDYNSGTTETQQHRRAALRIRTSTPLVDVVILSRADDKGVEVMTQHAIDSCISGANSLPVNVIVVEQNPDIKYDNAVTLHPPWEFNYNGFANGAAKLGIAEWIMVANNDLSFHDGWLHHLLAANHPFVSPKCPRDSRQQSIVRNTIGTRTGKHMSGWCFMVTRELWKKIGGFDDCVSFWCSDDVVIEQCKAVGVQPMLVPAAIVEHQQSVTLSGEPSEKYDELTWGQLEIFNQKYGRHRLSSHPEFQRWKRNHGR